jgi:hypothetical protein
MHGRLILIATFAGSTLSNRKCTCRTIAERSFYSFLATQSLRYYFDTHDHQLLPSGIQVGAPCSAPSFPLLSLNHSPTSVAENLLARSVSLPSQKGPEDSEHYLTWIVFASERKLSKEGGKKTEKYKTLGFGVPPDGYQRSSCFKGKHKQKEVGGERKERKEDLGIWGSSRWSRKKRRHIERSKRVGLPACHLLETLSGWKR